MRGDRRNDGQYRFGDKQVGRIDRSYVGVLKCPTEREGNMKIGDVNNYRVEQQKRLLDYMFANGNKHADRPKHKLLDVIGAAKSAKSVAIQDELIISINARAMAKLPQEQQYLRDENGNIRMGQIEDAQRRIEQRDYMNNAVETALREKGLSIAAGENYEISVDASYTFRVSGENAEKAELIASALNAAQVNPEDKMAKSYNTTSLARLIFGHMQISTNDFQVQATKAEMKKFQTDSALRQFTGLSLDDLRFAEDGIFTPDNRNIFDVIGDNISAAYGTSGLPSEASALSNSLKNDLLALQKIGIANIKDVEFKITLGADGLSDIGLNNGFGLSQRDWYDKLLTLRADPDAVSSYWNSIAAEPNAWNANGS
jgi:hypothetical protein